MHYGMVECLLMLKLLDRDLHGFFLDYKRNKFKGVVDYDFTFLSLVSV